MSLTTEVLKPNTTPSGLYPVLVGTKPKREEKEKLPLPTPKPNESESDFISRSMSNDIMQKEYPDQKQRAAVAYSQWRKGKKEEVALPSGLKIEPIKDAFNRWYNEQFGKGKFSNREGSDGYLKDKANQSIDKKEVVKDPSGGVISVADKNKAGPYPPDKGTERLTDIPTVNIFENPDAEKSVNMSETWRKTCAELKRAYDQMVTPRSE